MSKVRKGTPMMSQKNRTKKFKSSLIMEKAKRKYVSYLITKINPKLHPTVLPKKDQFN